MTTKNKTKKPNVNPAFAGNDGTIVFSAEALNAMIDNIVLDAKTWRMRMHRTLAATCLFAITTGQVGPMNRLFTETKTMTHDNNVARWLLEFGPVTFTTKEGFKFSEKRAKEFAGNLTPEGNDRENLPAYEAKLKAAKNYWDMTKPASPFSGFNLRQKLAKLLEEAEAYEEGVYASGKDTKGLPLSPEDAAKVHIQKDDVALLKKIVAAKEKAADEIALPKVAKAKKIEHQHIN